VCFIWRERELVFPVLNSFCSCMVPGTFVYVARRAHEPDDHVRCNSEDDTTLLF
jgi:hypothetical protein